MALNPMGNGVAQAQFSEYKKRMELVIAQLTKRIEDLENGIIPIQNRVPAIENVTPTEEKKTTRKKKVEE